MTRSIRLALLLLLVLGWTGPAVVAQRATGVRGVVTDETGGLIVGAMVTLTDEYGVKATGTTGQEGRYQIATRSRGKLTVTVEAAGFAPSSRTVVVTGTESATLDVKLRLAINDRVVVQGSLLGVSLDSDQNLSGVRLSSRSLDALPNDPESLLQSLRLLAASTGTRPDQVVFYVDGLPMTQRLPSKDIIQSVRINANPFSAEFAEPGSSRVEIITRPASGQYSGSARVDFNDARLNAQDPFQPYRADYQSRTFEGYAGGPIVRNRWGVLAYAGRWEQDDNVVVNATTIDPLTQQAAPLRLNVAAPTRTTSYSLKTNVQIGQRHTAAVEFAHEERERHSAGLESGFDLPERAYTGDSRERTASFWLTSASSSALNEFRGRASRNRLADRAVTAAPAILVLEAFNAGGNQDALFREDTTARVHVANVTTLARTAHSIRFGGQADVVRLEQIDRANFNGTFTFSSLDLYRRVLAGTPGYRPSQFSIVKGDPSVDLSIVEGAWFVQDDWRVKPRLTVSYGIRQDIQRYDGMRMRLAPRAGLAWAPSADGNSAIRAGMGVFYTPIPQRLFADTLRLDGRHGQQLVVDHPSFFPQVPDALPDVQNVTTTVRTRSANLTLPMMLVTTVSYDRQLIGSLFGSLGYTLRRGSDLLRTRNVGGVPGAGLAASHARNLQFESTGRSKAHEVSATVSGTLGPHTLFGSYGFTRAMQDTDDLYSVPADSGNLAAEWGRAAVPVHRVSIGGSLSLPSDYAIHPFVNWASPLPFNITSGNDTNLDSVFSDRPSFAAGQPGAIVTDFGIFNPNPQPGEPIIPRNLGLGPTNFTVDVTATKTFYAYKGATPSLRHATLMLGVSNLLNRTNYAGFNGVLTSPYFGTANRALNKRRVTVTLRYDF
jgi:hypothetical protein